MEHKFTITYKVNNDIPICPDHIHGEIKKAVKSVQAHIDAKNLNGDHKLELQAAGPWFEWPGITPSTTQRWELRKESSKRQASSAKLWKLQAASFKPGSVSPKLQAASGKLSDSWTTEHLNKFRGPRTESLGYDECVLRMWFMEGNLVCRKFEFITSGNF